METKYIPLGTKLDQLIDIMMSPLSKASKLSKELTPLFNHYNITDTTLRRTIVRTLLGQEPLEPIVKKHFMHAYVFNNKVYLETYLDNPVSRKSRYIFWSHPVTKAIAKKHMEDHDTCGQIISQFGTRTGLDYGILKNAKADRKNFIYYAVKIFYNFNK